MAFIGFKNAGNSPNFGGKVEEKKIQSNKMLFKYELPLGKFCNKNNANLKKSIIKTEIKEEFSSWALRFFYSFAYTLETASQQDSRFKNSSKLFEKILKKTAKLLKDSLVERIIFILKDNPLSLLRFISKPNSLKSNFPDAILYRNNCQISLQITLKIARISFGINNKYSKEISFGNKSGILFIRIDNSCERKFISFAFFNENNIGNVVNFLGNLASGEIVGFVQFGKNIFEELASKSKLFLEAIGLNTDLFFIPETKNTIFLGKKGFTKNEGFLQISTINENSMKINLCENKAFSNCIANLLYVRTEPKGEFYFSPLKLRYFYL